MTLGRCPLSIVRPRPEPITTETGSDLVESDVILVIEHSEVDWLTILKLT